MLASSTGDLGDILYLLNLLKHLPDGPHSLGLRPSPITKAKDQEQAQRMLNQLKPLIDAQDYIAEFKMIEPSTPVDWKSEDFRGFRHYTPGETLMQAHLNHFCLTRKVALKIDGATPWLKAKASKLSKGRVVINRTGRYRNPVFPWMGVVDHYKHHLLFTGLEYEWKEFCGHFGYVDFLPTENMLQVAEIIAGSELFIGNQSSAFAIAEGLKHHRIQETDLTYPDCIFPQAEGLPSVQHVATGDVILPAIGSRPEITLSRDMDRFRPIDRTVVPPGYWQYPGEMADFTLRNVASKVAAKIGVNLATAETMVYEHNCLRLPNYFAAEHHHLTRFIAAKKNAG
jgi:hypothetical protein